jgi:hypothetical protein
MEAKSKIMFIFQLIEIVEGDENHEIRQQKNERNQERLFTKKDEDKKKLMK